MLLFLPIEEFFCVWTGQFHLTRKRQRRKPMKLKIISTKFSLVIFSCLLFTAGCDDWTPRQIHLTVQGDSSTSVTISWVTLNELDTETHTVKHGLSSGDYTDEAMGISHELPNETSGYVHEVELTGLVPNTTYFYICGDGLGGWSPEYSFTTAPEAAQDFSFLVVADMGTAPTAWKIVDRMGSENFSFVLHPGDLSYANGLTFVWDIWFDQIMPVAARVPYMPSIGNHEDEGDLGLSSYLGRFALPNNERWYSFDWGNTHIVSLDTESEYTVGREQLGWLENDLASANTDWIVVFFHAPPYSASPERGSNLSVRDSISPLLEKHGVDVVFNGHAHVHERSYPILREVVDDPHPKVYDDPAGIIYVVTGGGGALLYRSGSEYWTASSRSIYHYVKVDIQAEETLHLQAISMGGTVIDEFWIHK
jgi:hypothetical protein